MLSTSGAGTGGAGTGASCAGTGTGTDAGADASAGAFQEEFRTGQSRGGDARAVREDAASAYVQFENLFRSGTAAVECSRQECTRRTEAQRARNRALALRLRALCSQGGDQVAIDQCLDGLGQARDAAAWRGCRAEVTRWRGAMRRLVHQEHALKLALIRYRYMKHLLRVRSYAVDVHGTGSPAPGDKTPTRTRGAFSKRSTQAARRKRMRGQLA